MSTETDIAFPELSEKDLAALTEIAEVISKYSEFGRRYQVTQIVNTLKQSLLRELDSVAV